MSETVYENGQVVDTKETRDQSFEQVRGELPELQAKVLQLVRRHGPGTAREIFEAADPGMVYSSFQPRLTKELREKGRVMALGKRECSVTGRTVTEWVAV